MESRGYTPGTLTSIDFLSLNPLILQPETNSQIFPAEISGLAFDILLFHSLLSRLLGLGQEDTDEIGDHAKRDLGIRIWFWGLMRSLLFRIFSGSALRMPDAQSPMICASLGYSSIQ